MTFDWQSIAVGSIIAGALAYLARRLWQRVRATSTADCATGCGQCENNSVPQPVKRIVMVSLQGRKK